jgi:hypothetical protein
MLQERDIFNTHYDDYCKQIGAMDFPSIAEILGVEHSDNQLRIRFFCQDYYISKNAIVDASGTRPDYGICVILAKYILLCPKRIHQDEQWVSFKDFKKISHFTNINFFTSDTERVITNHFSGRLDALAHAGSEIGGIRHESGLSYDLSMRFEALPRISLLLLFNEADDEFPAHGTVLFQKHAEFYLDPESLVMTSAALAKRLTRALPT